MTNDLRTPDEIEMERALPNPTKVAALASASADQMWIYLLKRLLSRFIKEGRLSVTLPGHPVMRFGSGREEVVAVSLRDARTARRVLLDPELTVGECYSDGSLRVENDDIQAFLSLLIRNSKRLHTLSVAARLGHLRRSLLRRVHQANSGATSLKNVSHHYDLTPAIYDLFLDVDRQYSCAYFAAPDMTLEAAQAAKKAHIARKLLIEPGMRVLDIGCGWGGMALTLARDYGARVTGITLSREQLAIARQRAVDAGLADRVNFELVDYRKVEGQFDRIVSVGMFEHVGAPNFDTFFNVVREHLTEDGVALVHTIGSTAPPTPTNPWIAKYIFPGGYVPTLSEVGTAIQNTGLRIADIEFLRLHYAFTLRHWFDRFSAKADVAASLIDETFVRAWRYYLAASEQTFRHTAQDVFQIQLSKKVDAVPITRNYLYAQPASTAHP